MAEVHASAEIDIEATPEPVWDVLTDLEAFPTWSKIHKDVRIESHNDEGWPERVWMKMSVVGIHDEQVVDHHWTDDSVSWELVSGGVQRAQRGTYTITPTETGCRAELEGMVDLVIPLPKLVIKQGQKLVMSIATKGIKAEAEKRQKRIDAGEVV